MKVARSKGFLHNRWKANNCLKYWKMKSNQVLNHCIFILRDGVYLLWVIWVYNLWQNVCPLIYSSLSKLPKPHHLLYMCAHKYLFQEKQTLMCYDSTNSKFFFNFPNAVDSQIKHDWQTSIFKSLIFPVHLLLQELPLFQ